MYQKNKNRPAPIEVGRVVRPRVLRGSFTQHYFFFKKNSAGFSTLEILIAFGVLIMAVTAVILVIFGNQSVAVDTETNSEALSKAQAMLEVARADSRFDFNLVNPKTTTEVSGPLTYTKKLDVNQINLFTKQATSTVAWEMGNRTLYVALTTLLANPQEVDGGDTCSSVLTGDWMNPQKTEYEFGSDILGDTSSGFPITSIQAFDKKLYVAVNNDNGNNDETFFILDISDPTIKPAVLGRLDNSPAPNDISEGLNAMAVDGGNYAFVANAYDSSPQDCSRADNCAQLQVIQTNCVDNNGDGIDDICSPAVVKDIKIPSVKTGNKLAQGTSIYYKDGIVYLGLAKAITGNDEFYVIDVGGGAAGGSPVNPIVLDSAKIDNGVNSIFVKGNYAYIASPNDEELKIFDVSAPSSINEVGGFNSSEGDGNGKSLYLVSNKLYLGKTVPNAGADFHILNNTDPASTLTEIGPGIDSASSINGIIVRGYLAFFITNTQFQTWNISDPTAIVSYASPLALPGTGIVQGTAADCEGNYIYVGSLGSNDKGYISIITSGP